MIRDEPLLPIPSNRGSSPGVASPTDQGARVRINSGASFINGRQEDRGRRSARRRPQAATDHETFTS